MAKLFQLLKQKIAFPKKLMILIAAVVVLAIVFVAGVLLSRPSEEEPEFVNVSTLQKIVNTSNISSFSSVYNGVVQVNNEKKPEDVDYYVCYAAKIKAGIDLSEVKFDIDKDDKTIYRFTEKVRDTLAFMPYAEIIFISALTGQRLGKLYETIDIVAENHALRVGTGVLNEIMTEAVAMQQPPADKGKRLRLYYITQVSVKPPTFVIFVNDKELMHFSYTRYIENQIRDAFGFKGTPLRFIIRERKEKDQ
jgi:predicted GTPase